MKYHIDGLLQFEAPLPRQELHYGGIGCTSSHRETYVCGIYGMYGMCGRGVLDAAEVEKDAKTTGIRSTELVGKPECRAQDDSSRREAEREARQSPIRGVYR